MIRSTYRNLMLLMLVLCFGVAFFVFRKSQDYQVDISNRENDIVRLRQEFENAQSLDVALKELDGLTITEQTATQLDILRHLGLEQSTLDFGLESRDVQSIGITSLYVHNVRITSRMPYEASLQLADRLQNTKKIVLDAIELNAPGSGDNGNVSMVLTGKIYGLDKVLNPVAAAPESAPTAPIATQDASISGTSPEGEISASTPADDVSQSAPETVSPSGTVVEEITASSIKPSTTEVTQ